MPENKTKQNKTKPTQPKCVSLYMVFQMDILVAFYFLEYSDYCRNIHYYIHNVSADAFFVMCLTGHMA